MPERSSLWAWSCLFFSAMRITNRWKMLNNTGDVGPPTLRPLWGTQPELSPSFPFTEHSLVSWRSLTMSRKYPKVHIWLGFPKERFWILLSMLSGGRAVSPLGQLMLRSFVLDSCSGLSCLSGSSLLSESHQSLISRVGIQLGCCLGFRSFWSNCGDVC